MAIITYTRGARCKDCIFHKPFWYGKRKITKCLLGTGRDIPKFTDKDISLKDLVCEQWKIK